MVTGMRACSVDLPEACMGLHKTAWTWHMVHSPASFAYACNLDIQVLWMFHHLKLRPYSCRLP